MNRKTSIIDEPDEAGAKQGFDNNEFEPWDIDDRLYEEWRERKWFHEIEKENNNQKQG